MASAGAAAFRSLRCSRQLAQHVLVGMGAASFWRGAWYVLDDNLFPEDRLRSAAASLGLGTLGMAASQGLVERAERLAEQLAERRALRRQTPPPPSTAEASTSASKPSLRRSYHQNILAARNALPPKLLLATTRIGALYTVAVSCVLVWRGTWIGWDLLYERLHPQPELTVSHDAAPSTIRSTDPGHLTQSGVLSHVTAVLLLLTTGLFASVLAPPAAASIIRDVSVRAGQTYVGPAQKLADRLFAGATQVQPRRAMTTRPPGQVPVRGRSPPTP